MSALQWDTRKAYALTEFTTFAIGTVVLLAVATFSAVVVCYFYRHRNSKNESEKLKTVMSLHRSILRAVFADTVKMETPSGGTIQTLIFSDYKPQPSFVKKTIVYVYFSLLSGLVALWFLAAFSDSLFYRKTSTCNDVSVKDTDI